ncbi:S-layer homology domain-containing protein [Candidatus Gracilibacteria bacterium]|nr:S-layer homology domain-containing protein [Candidatus Gracilibacteria bacterium]
MKKIFFGLSFCWINPISAFFVDAPIFERLDQKIHIEINQDIFQIEIVETIQNNSEVTQNLEYFFPLNSTAQNIQFFVNANGKDFEILTGQKKLNFLFEKAKKHKMVQFFRLSPSKWPKTFVSDTFELPSKKPVEIKLKYQQKLDFIHDFFFSELFLNDEILSKNFELVLSIIRPRPILHFLPIFSSVAKSFRLENQIVWMKKETNFIPQENFSFFFSETENPALNFPAFNAIYHGNLKTDHPTQNFEKILILVDTSGSVFGSPWNRIGDILQEFLEKIQKTTTIQLIFFNQKEIKEKTDGFESNSQDLREKFFKIFKQTKPTEKTDFGKIFTILENFKKTPNLGVLLLGDFQDLSLSSDELKTIQTWDFPIFTLDFSFDKNDLDLLTHHSGGNRLNLFRTPYFFIESEEFWEKWNAQLPPLEAKSFQQKYPKQSEFLPLVQKFFSPYVFPLFVSREFSGKTPTHSELENFLPRLWGARKIAHILRTFCKLNDPSLISEESIKALISIARTFGIKTSIFSEPTNPITVRNVLAQTSKKELWREIFALENPEIFYPPSTAKFIKNIPFYLNEKVWQQFNFHEKNKTEKLITLAPFSPAQKDLFLAFPELLGELFGLANEIDFCHKDLRCLSIREGSREKALPSDYFFWNGFHTNHWANGYLKILADQFILPLSANGNALPDQKITRGEFVKMSAQYFYGEEWKMIENVYRFGDLDENSKIAKAANFLAEKNVIHGYSDQTFRPHQNLSRAEAVKILLAIKGVIQPEDWTPPTNLPFPDTPGWEKFWVLTAFNQKMVQGFSDGRFWPNRYLTRGQAAKLIVEAEK